ncbi:MAG: MBL fold metallo-hydrolase [Traorella sp.]
MKFYLLASGSKGNCCVIENHDTKIVIDCGGTQKYLKEAFKKINCNINDLDGVLLTHSHQDHIASLKLFHHLPIYSQDALEVDFQILIEEDECFQINSLRIESIRLSHDEKCLGFIIQDEKEKLVYITDTGYLKEQYYEKIYGADYYIFESNHDLKMLIQSRRPQYVKNRIRSDYGHLCNEDCARYLKKCVNDNTKQVVLAHISQEANTKELAYSTTRQALDDHIEVIAAGQFEIIEGGNHD